MNDLDDVLRETLEAHAETVTPSPGLAAMATRRSRQIRHRRVAAAGATTAVVVGATSVVAAHAIGQPRNGSGRSQTVQVAAPTGGVSSSAPGTPAPAGQGSSPDPSATPNFESICPDGQAPAVTATGSATDSGAVQSDGRAQTVAQSVMQSYLVDISNHVSISQYGVGTDSGSGHGVVWIEFQDHSVVEIVINDAGDQWASYPAALGACTALGN